MKTLHLNLKKEIDESYDITIEPNLIERVSYDLESTHIGDKYAIITDSNVRSLYGEKLLRVLNERKIKACLIDFPAGEKSKNLSIVSHLISRLIKNRLGRKSAIIALGGGVVGDVAGFTSSVFMRGIPYFQIPTTLLAQVDSSIGGKTAVNTIKGKNLIGSFYQPKRVFIDITTLKTLPKAEFISGLAEVIKYGVIYNKEFFEYLEKNIEKIKNLDQENLMQIVWNSSKIKKEVVEEDLEEGNKRAILNYGHTPAHVFETLSSYKYTHGEAVAIGMNISGRLAVRKGFLKVDELERQNNLLKAAGLPLMCKFNLQEFVEILYRDKKVEGGRIMFVLPRKIGEMATINGKYKIPISEEELVALLKEC